MTNEEFKFCKQNPPTTPLTRIMNPKSHMTHECHQFLNNHTEAVTV